jgi:hypothetical protein
LEALFITLTIYIFTALYLATLIIGELKTVETSEPAGAPLVQSDLEAQLQMQVRDGRVLAIASVPTSMLLRIPTWQSASWNVLLLLLSIGALVGTVLHWPMRKAGNPAETLAGNRGPRIRVQLAIGLVGVIGSAVVGWHAWLAWKNHRGLATRICSIVVTVACLAIASLAFVFRLITFSY